MARLPAGTLPTPVNVRLKRYSAELKEAGGRRVVVDLEKEAADALAQIQTGAEVTIKDAITQALVAHARTLSKRKRSAGDAQNFLLGR